MPQDDLYWNPIDVDSDDSFQDASRSKQSYIDPWDLENYAYIRDHLESMELSSNPSLTVSGSSSGEFAEANSTSFCYVPGKKLEPPAVNERKNYDSLATESGNYAAIDEVSPYSGRPIARSDYMTYKRPTREFRRPVLEDSGTDLEDNSYVDGSPESSAVFGIYDKNGYFRKVALPVTPLKDDIRPSRDRSISYSYGDNQYDPYMSRHEMYNKLDEPARDNQPIPIYDDIRRLRRKPDNFGLSNYGHLKIDYSYSWNNLNKYMKYN